MATDVEICNLALAHLGVDPISSLSETRTQARMCALFYPICRDMVLRRHKWTFAQKIHTLTAIELPDIYKSGKWCHAYVFPNDCLKPHEIREADLPTPKAFEIRRLPTGEKIIMTNSVPAHLYYTMRVNDANWFDAQFVASFGYLLGASMAMPLTRNLSLRAALMQDYDAQIPEAEASNEQEQLPTERMGDNPWIAARTGL